MFTVYNRAETDSTVISNLFIDQYMSDANDAQLKIYLYLIRMMSAQEATSISDMADKFNHTEKEVLRSLKYWERRGLLSLNYDSAGKIAGIHLREPRERAALSGDRIISITPMLQARTEQMTPEKKSKPKVRDEEKNKQLFFIVEQYIGKPLAPKEVDVIRYISEELSFSDDLIDYLVQYCVDRGKKDFRYIEKVAINWAEGGITTPKQAQSALLKAQTGKPAGGRIAKQKENTFRKTMRHDYDFVKLEKEILGEEDED